ncbi:hypothetical protein DERP_000687 [Dermatophagoides pteronyssinus]|uniref:Uncharacterized protein n=1 Tax=Dermatophagoides pteronyssinus TaxID=6956 RepID=A0ABQ8J0V6_DERPT|nr:hypothetical protein DERP_000687 [Dermatophagoides pteronyssinus]
MKIPLEIFEVKKSIKNHRSPNQPSKDKITPRQTPKKAQGRKKKLKNLIQINQSTMSRYYKHNKH